MAAVAQLFAVAALLSSPAPTSPGLRIAWSDASSGELWIARGDGRLRTKIDTLFWPGGVPGAFGTPAWSPSGSRLAYWASPKPHVQVLRVNRLRGARYVETWSRGDGSVFFVVGRKTKPRTLMRASGRSAPVDETNWPGEPLWSADGSHLAFFRLDGHLEVVDVRTGRSRLIRTRRLADGWVYSLTVSLSPDGRHAVVVNTGHGGAWIADLRDGSLRRFAPRGARIGEAAWSPDGKWLAYTRGDARGNGQLLAASVDARRVIRLTNDVPRDPFSHFSNTSPAWSPDG
ncbi:MAG TPA: hypothetical protein VF101_08415, partial [Gaiellaceae bacterium]